MLTQRLFLFVLLTVFSLVFARADDDAPPTTINPEGDTGLLKTMITTGGSYDAHSGNGTRIVNDLNVPNTHGYGLGVNRYWQSLESGGGGGWCNGWIFGAEFSEEWIDADTAEGNGHVIIKMTLTVSLPEGRKATFTLKRSDQYYPPHLMNSNPPYTGQLTSNPNTYQNWFPSVGSTEHMGAMDPNLAWFWLMRSDGGAIKYTDTGMGLRPTEMRDPNGLLTTIYYNGQGEVTHVVEPGGRCLYFTWAPRTVNWGTQGQPDWRTFRVLDWIGWTTSTSIPSTSCVQKVQYGYEDKTDLDGLTYPYLVSANVVAGTHPGDPSYASAYTYRLIRKSYYTDVAGHALASADDRRFDGPMQRITYEYRGEYGPDCAPGNPPSPPLNNKLSNFTASNFAIRREMNWYGGTVSSFFIPCNGNYDTGTRTENNGVGGGRKFYFGHRSGEEPGVDNYGYQLGAVTDYTGNENLRSIQRYGISGQVQRVYDFRGTRTDYAYAGASGRISLVTNVGSDQSTKSFNYTVPGASAARDTTAIPNSQFHWLFSKTDERGFTTTYVRDSLRRVTQVIHPSGGGTESFTYDSLNRVLTHTLVNGTVITHDYTVSGTNPFGQLAQVYNNSDGIANATIYTYYGSEAGGYPGLVKTVSLPRARVMSAPFSAQFEYNSRQQITKVTYPATMAGRIRS